jgi:hypothetical protein
VTVLATEAIGGGAAAGEAGAAGGAGRLGALAPIAAANQQGGQPDGSAIVFAMAILLLGFACIGFWLAFHKPQNAETGGFPGLFGQMLQWVHASELEQGAADVAGAAAPTAGDKLKGIPSGILKALEGMGGGPFGQFKTWFLHIPNI